MNATALEKLINFVISVDIKDMTSEEALSAYLQKGGIGAGWEAKGSQWELAFTRGWYASQLDWNPHDTNPYKGTFFTSVYWEEGWWAYFFWKEDTSKNDNTLGEVDGNG